MTKDFKNLNDDFSDFLSASEMEPPLHLQEKILGFVHADLNPSQKSIFMKILGIHALVSLGSLSLCSQFGIQTFHVFNAMETFMQVVGHTYCMAFCGLLYLGISALAFSFSLRPEEIKIIRRHRFLQFGLLAGVSLGVFLCLGEEILLVPSLLWLTGSIAGGAATLELGWLVRSKFRQRLIFE